MPTSPRQFGDQHQEQHRRHQHGGSIQSCLQDYDDHGDASGCLGLSDWRLWFLIATLQGNVAVLLAQLRNQNLPHYSRL